MYDTSCTKHGQDLHRYNMRTGTKVTESNGRDITALFFKRFIRTGFGSENVVPTLANDVDELIALNKDSTVLSGEML